MIGQRKRLTSGLTVTSKVFVRSRNGNALKIVREHYLRPDIPCYSHACAACLTLAAPDANGHSPGPILSDSPLLDIDSIPHYILVDTNIVFHAIDMLESPLCFFDVIVPQTVLEEVRNRSYPVYLRLRALVKAEDKRFVIFHNEYCIDTFQDRQPKESINDRNDRAIRKTASWYQKHIPRIRTYFVCNDTANREHALAEGLHAVSLTQYIEKLPNAADLHDLVPQDISLFISDPSGQAAVFSEYYSDARKLAGLRQGTLYQGIMSILPYNVLQGTVLVDAFKKPLLIKGTQNMNRAFNGDSVIVELLPQSEWLEPSDMIVDDSHREDQDDINDTDVLTPFHVSLAVVSDKERLLLAKEAMRVNSDTSEQAQSRKCPTARVVGISRRSWRYYVGQILPASVDEDSLGHSSKSCLIVLMDKLLPKLRIRTRKARELLGQRIVVVVDSWPSNSRFPNGHFVRSLGPMENSETETEALLLEHDVEYRPFAKNVLSCLPSKGDKWECPSLDNSDSIAADPQLKKRLDLRAKLVCSIDPLGCVDIDDALHAEILPNGNYEVGVHIADVTHFVKPGTALDTEGASRGTSVYLVSKRIDMLPMLLGTNLCSLKPLVERLAFSVIWEVDANANVISTQYTKLIIKSRKAFSYEQAQQRIDDPSQNDELTMSIRILLQLSKKLKQKRLDAGALNLASPEVKVHMDSEISDPNQVEIKSLLETNLLVEEFMLFANIAVARKIYDAYPQTALLRRHVAPPSTNFEKLNQMLDARKPGLALSLELSQALANSLDRCIDENDPFFNTLVRIMLTRCMMAAEYFLSGLYGFSNFRHYGLAVEIYTHFTSPIRRYCDVVVHRQLAGAIGYENLDLSHRDKNKMEGIVRNINRRHRNAQFAGRASINYYVGQVMRDNVSQHEGYVILCFHNGIVVLVPQFGVESMIRIENMGNASTAVFNEDKFELEYVNLQGNKKNVAVFDKVLVNVELVKDNVNGKRSAQLLLKD